MVLEYIRPPILLSPSTFIEDISTAFDIKLKYPEYLDFYDMQFVVMPDSKVIFAHQVVMRNCTVVKTLLKQQQTPNNNNNALR